MTRIDYGSVVRPSNARPHAIATPRTAIILDANDPTTQVGGTPEPVKTPPILDQRFRPLINEVMTADVSRLRDGHDLRAKYYLYFKSMVLHEDAGYERFNESFGLFRLSVARILRNELEYRLKLARAAEKSGVMSPEVKKLLSEGDVGCAENNLPTGGLCDAIDATSIEGIENSLDKLRYQVKELDDDRKE